MERKAFHALLLSLAVIAGAMTITTDAHAQTNTERLATVEDNTNSIIAALSGISDAIAAGFAAVMEALGAIQTDVDTIHDEVETLHSEVDSFRDDVAATQTGLEGIGDAVGNIDTKIDAVNSAITAAVTAMDAEPEADPQIAQILEGVTTNAATINALADRLTAVDTMLEAISTKVGAVQETVATSADGTATALSELHSDTVTYAVPVSAFGANKADATTYKADLTLECESPVFLDTITTNNPSTYVAGTGADNTESQKPFSPSAAGDAAATTPDKVSVVANGMTVYDTRFQTGTALPSVYSAGASFDLAELAAGKSLTIKLSTDRTETFIGYDDSVTTDDGKQFNIKRYLNTDARAVINASETGTIAAGVNTTSLTKAEAGKVEVFALTIELYSSAEDAKCTVTPPTGPSVDYAQTDQVVSFAITAPETETRSIKTITDATFSCSGATAITKVSLEGGLIADFATFVDLTLSADTEKSLSFKKVPDTAVLEAILEDPLEITSGMVTLSGKIPGSSALVSVTYDTVKDAKCSTS